MVGRRTGLRASRERLCERHVGYVFYESRGNRKICLFNDNGFPLPVSNLRKQVTTPVHATTSLWTPVTHISQRTACDAKQTIPHGYLATCFVALGLSNNYLSRDNPHTDVFSCMMAAASKVYGISELRELILLQMDMRTLLLASESVNPSTTVWWDQRNCSRSCGSCPCRAASSAPVRSIRCY